MSRNRLHEFRLKADITGEKEFQPLEPKNQAMDNKNDDEGSGDTVIEVKESVDSEVESYFMEVNDTRKMIQELDTDVERVKQLHKTIFSSVYSDERKKVELDNLISVIKTSSQVIRLKLKDMKEANFQAQEEGGASAPVRIRTTQHSALQQSFIDVMYEYQIAQTKYRDKCKAQIKRQIEITGKNFSEGEVDDMIEKGNWSVFTQGIIVLETQQAKKVLADVEARHQDIQKLEQSLLDLHGLFAELAVMVEAQGHVVNSIAASVMETVDYADKGRRELRKAVILKKKVRKKQICVYLTLAMVVLIIALILTSYFCGLF
ncbi:unnamed protein product [Orchesella dallaii]|uniref:t-SNARE coiled-coil homology domain-containing protein n=1 Tax=Orchesella dallaii TaxID=48710 RepID=A0ABP1RVH7_9HEXA